MILKWCCRILPAEALIMLQGHLVYEKTECGYVDGGDYLSGALYEGRSINKLQNGIIRLVFKM